MPDIVKEWERKDKPSISDSIKQGIVRPEPLRGRLEQAGKKLSEQIRQLERVSDRLEKKDRDISEDIVKAFEQGDRDRAISLANELEELRKVEKRTQFSKYALEKALSRIEMAHDFGEIAAVIAPVGQVVKNVQGSLSEFLPATSTALGEVSGIMSETLASISHISEGAFYSPSSEDADKILQEAAAVSESRLKGKLPPTEGEI